MPLFGKKKIVLAPQIQTFLENIVKNNPSYAALPENKRDDLIQKLARELNVEVDKVLNNNLNEYQLLAYNDKQRKSQLEAEDYASKTIPNFNEKIQEVFQKFYQKHTKK